MSRLQRMRSAITGRFVGSFAGIDNPDTTVMERVDHKATVGELDEVMTAAEAVILGEGYAQAEGRTEVNQADLDRLKAAIGFVQGQP